MLFAHQIRLPHVYCIVRFVIAIRVAQVGAILVPDPDGVGSFASLQRPPLFVSNDYGRCIVGSQGVQIVPRGDVLESYVIASAGFDFESLLGSAVKVFGLHRSAIFRGLNTKGSCSRYQEVGGCLTHWETNAWEPDYVSRWRQAVPVVSNGVCPGQLR